MNRAIMEAIEEAGYNLPLIPDSNELYGLTNEDRWYDAGRQEE